MQCTAARQHTETAVFVHRKQKILKTHNTQHTIITQKLWQINTRVDRQPIEAKTERNIKEIAVRSIYGNLKF